MNTIPRPGPARITLVLLALVPAVLGYPWSAPRERWVLAVGVLVAVLLLGWWQGLHFTTMARRRLAMSRSGAGVHTDPGSDADPQATAVVRVAPSVDSSGALPVSLLAGYLDRYGLHADMVRITSRNTRSEQETWIGLTYSAAANLAALQARSSNIPLRQTVDVAARRLADHLREIGWDATLVAAGDIPEPVDANAQQVWGAVADGSGGYVAAYRLGVDGALSENLGRVRSAEVPESWTVLELAGDAAHPTVAAACVLRTASVPAGAPLSGLVGQQGNHRAALLGLHPFSGQRLAGHTVLPAGDLAALRWPVAPVRATSTR